MKKLTSLFGFTILSVLVNCGSPVKAGYEDTPVYGISPRVSYSDYQMDGMEYRIFTTSGATSPTIVNRTKERLEVELLRKQSEALDQAKR